MRPAYPWRIHVWGRDVVRWKALSSSGDGDGGVREGGNGNVGAFFTSEMA